MYIIVQKSVGRLLDLRLRGLLLQIDAVAIKIKHNTFRSERIPAVMDTDHREDSLAGVEEKPEVEFYRAFLNLYTL